MGSVEGRLSNAYAVGADDEEEREDNAHHLHVLGIGVWGLCLGFWDLVWVWGLESGLWALGYERKKEE